MTNGKSEVATDEEWKFHVLCMMTTCKLIPIKNFFQHAALALFHTAHSLTLLLVDSILGKKETWKFILLHTWYAMIHAGSKTLALRLPFHFLKEHCTDLHNDI